MLEAREIKERYVVDEKGNRVGVLLDIEDYQWLLEALEELRKLTSLQELRQNLEESKPEEPVPLTDKNGILVVKSVALEDLRGWEKELRKARLLQLMGERQ